MLLIENPNCRYSLCATILLVLTSKKTFLPPKIFIRSSDFANIYLATPSRRKSVRNMTISAYYHEIYISNWTTLMFTHQEMRMRILATDSFMEGAFTPRWTKGFLLNLKNCGEIIFNHWSNLNSNFWNLDFQSSDFKKGPPGFLLSVEHRSDTLNILSN